jgi:hypothetical protein
VTALTASRVRYGVGPDLICQSGPSPAIKTRSSPAAFPTTLSLPFVPFPSLTPSCTTPLVPQAAPSSTYSPARPQSPQNRYDAASEKNVAARRLTLIRSTPRQHCLIDRLTRASTPDNDADEAPGVPAGRRRLGHATASDAGLLSFKLRPPIHHTSCLNRGRPRPRQHADWLRHHYVVLLPISTAAGFGQGWLGLGADCAATRPMEKMPHAQAVPSRMAQRLAGAGSK